MRVLTVIAHYYKPEAKKGYGSTDAAMRDNRYKYLEEALLRWRVLFGNAVALDMVKRALSPVSSAIHVDIVILKTGDNHVVDDAMKHKYGIKLIDVQALPHPRLLPFAAHQVMAQNAGKYDWFVYSEDDIGMVDATYFHKCKEFIDNCGGWGQFCLLQPHRYERRPGWKAKKVYVDGDMADSYLQKSLSYVPHSPGSITLNTPIGVVTCARPSNPHSGVFCLSSEQLAWWMKQAHFMDRDCSFISPLESAATLGLMKTFAVYKTLAPHMDYLTVEHLGGR